MPSIYILFSNLARALPEPSFRRGALIDTLTHVHETVYYDPEAAGRDTFLAALRAVRPYLQEALAVQNARSAPFAGLIGGFAYGYGLAVAYW